MLVVVVMLVVVAAVVVVMVAVVVGPVDVALGPASAAAANGVVAAGVVVASGAGRAERVAGDSIASCTASAAFPYGVGPAAPYFSLFFFSLSFYVKLAEMFLAFVVVPLPMQLPSVGCREVVE